MNSLSPYLFRCYNKEMSGQRDQRYSTLDNIGSKDLYLILKQFIQSNSSSFKIIEKSKQVYQFSDISFDDENREITGWFNVGYYGMKTEIINVDTGDVDFEKAQNNAEIIRHYVHFFIPRGFNEAMAFLHTVRGTGVKTLFHELFSAYFFNITNLVLQMNPLAYDKAVSAWLDASAKEVKLTKFVGLADVSDQLRLLGHCEQELIIKAPRRGTLGRLRDYLTPNTPQLRAIEMIEEFGSQVKTVVELDGKTRTFCIGRNKSTPLCEIMFDDSVGIIEGVPVLIETKNWVRLIVQEYSSIMYPGLNLEVA